MIDPVQVLWSPAGATIPSLGDLALVDVHDGDTPSVRMSVRMLSIDTPEITAISTKGALNVDRKFADLAQWITDRKAPITPALAERAQAQPVRAHGRRPLRHPPPAARLPRAELLGGGAQDLDPRPARHVQLG